MWMTRRYLFYWVFRRSCQRTQPHNFLSTSHSNYSVRSRARKKCVKYTDTMPGPAVIEMTMNDQVSNQQENTETGKVDFLSSEFNEKVEEITKELLGVRRKPAATCNYGTPDKSIEISTVPCGGCGAFLHCQDFTLPGYIPSEVFKELTDEQLKDAKCQKCHKMQHQSSVVDIRASDSEAQKIIADILKKRKCLVLLVVDLFDIENSIPDFIPFMIPMRMPVYVIGNKVDVIPQDNPHYLKSVKNTLLESCSQCGLGNHNIQNVSLISAKTGYGVENLISTLLNDWGMQGDVYMIGTVNSGKSTLYNALLNSDYCNHKIRDVVCRATVSELPGTTISMLRFPVMNSKTNWLMAMRRRRLHDTLEKDMLRQLKDTEKTRTSKKLWASSILTTLRGTVEKTDFDEDEERRAQYSGFELSAYEYGNKGVKTNDGKEFVQEKLAKYDENNYQNSHFFHDTPGFLSDMQILSYLQPEELKLITPTRKIVPHCILLKPDKAVFITGLGRVDYLEGNQDVMLIIYISPKLPIHIVSTQEADDFYTRNIGTDVLGLPLGDKSRLEKLPPLESRDFRIRPREETYNVAAVDIQLSSLGWVSMVGMLHTANVDVALRVYTPGARGIYLRPPMLKKAHVFHLNRIKNTLKYKRNKPKIKPYFH